MISTVLGRQGHELDGKIFIDATHSTRVLLIPITEDFDYSEYRTKLDGMFDGQTLLPYLLDERDAMIASVAVYSSSGYDVSEVESYKVAGKAHIKGRYGNSGSYTGLIIYRNRKNNQACVCTAIIDIPRNERERDGIADTIKNYSEHVRAQGYLSKGEERRLNTCKALAQNQLKLVSDLLAKTDQTDEVQELLIARRRYIQAKLRDLNALVESSYE